MSTLSESKLRSWMNKLGPRLIVLSAGICRDQHRAEEIVQEAFIKLWRQPPDAGEIAYPSWLRRVVTNLSINALQRTKRPQTLPEFSGDRAMRSGTDEEAQRQADAREELRQVSGAMDRLDPAKRAILMLRAHEGLSYEEIANHLDVPVGTVMSRLNRARQALMDEMRSVESGRNVQSSVQSDSADPPEVFKFRKYKSA